MRRKRAVDWMFLAPSSSCVLHLAHFWDFDKFHRWGVVLQNLVWLQKSLQAVFSIYPFSSLNGPWQTVFSIYQFSSIDRLLIFETGNSPKNLLFFYRLRNQAFERKLPFAGTPPSKNLRTCDCLKWLHHHCLCLHYHLLLIMSFTFFNLFWLALDFRVLENFSLSAVVLSAGKSFVQNSHHANEHLARYCSVKLNKVLQAEALFLLEHKLNKVANLILLHWTHFCSFVKTLRQVHHALLLVDFGEIHVQGIVLVFLVAVTKGYVAKKKMHIVRVDQAVAVKIKPKK